jgi:hypothetical protein
MRALFLDAPYRASAATLSLPADLEIAEQVATAIQKSGTGTISDADREAINDAVVARLVPAFTSLG